MGDFELLESVDLARERLIALRAVLEGDGKASGSPEIVSALSDLQEMFDDLQARYGLLRQILDRTNDVVFAKNRDGRYAMINPLRAELFGKSMDEVLGVDDRALFEPGVAEEMMAMDREVMRSEEPATRESWRDVRGVQMTWITTTAPWYDLERHVRGVIGIVQDVTDHRRAEREAVTELDRMRTMAGDIVIGEERLRRSLAAELHTGLGQDIALAKLKLAMLRRSASVDLHGPLSGIEELVEQADRSLRSITLRISPPTLHDLGLVAALEWLAEDVRAKYGVDVRIEDDDSSLVADESIRVILFRAVRELLIDTGTHTSVREAVVRVARDGALVRITVQDAGVGFDAADLDRRGLGFFAIGEQLKYVGGGMQIDSSAERGTTVTLTAPAAFPASCP